MPTRPHTPKAQSETRADARELVPRPRRWTAGVMQPPPPRLVLGIVAIVAAVAGLVGWTAPSHLSHTTSDLYSHSSESFSTMRELETTRPKGSRGPPNLIVITQGNPQTAGQRTKRRLERLPEVAAASQYTFSSRDGQASNLFAWLRKGVDEGAAAAEVARALDHPGVVVGSPALVKLQLAEQIKHDLWRAELIAFPLLLFLGLWVFRSVVSALLPVLVGGFALVCALGCLRAVNEIFPLSIFALNIAVGLALGLGVDYSLLMVSRFREELLAGRSPRDASLVTIRTAGRTVAFSAAVIAVSFSSLLVFPIPLARSVAVGGILVALIAGLGALLVLPALFSLLGARVNALAPRAWRRAIEISSHSREQGAWYRIAHFVMRRPISIAVASAALLVVLGLPSLTMRFTGYDVTSLPTSASARVFTEQIRNEFEHPIVGEIELAIHGNKETAFTVMDRVNQLARRTGLATPFSVGFQLSSRLLAVNLNPTNPVLSDETKRFVKRLRNMNAPITVAGETAAYMDTATTLKRYIPLALAVLAVVSFLFLFLATGSIILPIKALIMNVLSLSAAFGVLVMIFQDGRFQEVLDYQSQNALVVILPIVMGASAFGLLTDYGLFLLMRIREAREEGLPDREAIALGLERTGRIITSAALLFCVAVGAFATSGVVFVKAAAIGIMAAVVLDGFVVRPLLVPSLMTILGKWNWWPRDVTIRQKKQPTA